MPALLGNELHSVFPDFVSKTSSCLYRNLQAFFTFLCNGQYGKYDIAGNIISKCQLLMFSILTWQLGHCGVTEALPAKLLLAALNRQFELLLSVPLILEYEAVMTRPQHLAACGLSSAEVGHIIDDLAAAGSTCVPMAAKAIRSS
jgi:hypothetical protein